MSLSKLNHWRLRDQENGTEWGSRVLLLPCHFFSNMASNETRMTNKAKIHIPTKCCLCSQLMFSMCMKGGNKGLTAVWQQEDSRNVEDHVFHVGVGLKIKEFDSLSSGLIAESSLI